VLYNQPLAIRFGTELIRQIDPVWDQIDIAVAWVRASGMAYLSQPLVGFLRHGGKLSVIVGIDLENTTKQGLEALLDLEEHGTCEIFVYHNEANSVFHPKLYLWRNEEEARLIVGSNNITQAGLYVNVEAGLQVDSAIDDPLIIQTLDAISSWKDSSSGLVKKLDRPLLSRLVADGYVPDETAIRMKMRTARATRSARQTPKIFGSRQFVPPVLPRAPAARASGGQTTTATQTRTRTPATPVSMVPSTPTGEVLLMRLRKVSVTMRATQTQIPFRAVNAFFGSATAVRSTHSGELHDFIQTKARGKSNTIRIEIPEMRNFDQPLARFERTTDGIVYEVYDVGSAQGNQILASLEEGRSNGTTQLSITDAETATWWRFI
jgi:HKD family nuclease